jgi:hypothetical protein
MPNDMRTRKSYYCEGHAGDLEQTLHSGQKAQIVQLFGFVVDEVRRL